MSQTPPRKYRIVKVTDFDTFLSEVRSWRRDSDEVRDFDTFLSGVRSWHRDSEELWFRGQPHLGLPLRPKVMRIFRGRRYLERILTQSFRLRAKSRYPDCPHIWDYPSWLFLMQHYGVPTRLLDWSASPLVALFFAVWDRRADPRAMLNDLPDCDVFVLRPLFLNAYERNNGFERAIFLSLLNHAPHRVAGAYRHFDWIDPWSLAGRQHFSRPFFRPAYNDPNYNPDVGAVLPIKPIELDPRVTAQSSRFTLHERRVALQNHPIAGHMLGCIRIPGPIRREMLWRLWDLEITQANLFPDLDALGEEFSIYKNIP